MARNLVRPRLGPWAAVIMVVAFGVVVAGCGGGTSSTASPSAALSVSYPVTVPTCPVYEAAAYCQQGVGGADAVIGAIVTDVRAVGQLTNRQGQAAKAIGDFQSRIEAVTKAVAGMPRVSAVLMYYFGPMDGQPSIYANQSTIGTAIEVAGGRQAFADVGKVSGRVSREEIIARAPDYLVIINQNTHPSTEVVTSLKGNPDFQRVPVVQNNHVVEVSFDTALPNLRYAETAEQLAKAFHGVTIGR